MRRPFFALPLLLALVVGALAGPSTSATAVEPNTDPTASVTETGMVYGFVDSSAPFRLNVRLWARNETGTWAPTSLATEFPSNHEVPGFRIKDVPYGTYRLEILPYAAYPTSPEILHRTTGSSYFLPAADDVDSAADVVVANDRTSAHFTLRENDPVLPRVEPAVTEAGTTGAFSVSNGTWTVDSRVVARQWFHAQDPSDEPIAVAGATSSTFTPGPELGGHALAVRTTVRAPGRPDTEHWTKAVVATKPFDAAPRLAARDVTFGAAGRITLTGTWSPRPTRTELIVDGEPQGVDTDTFHVPARLAGRSFSVQLVATDGTHRTVLSTTARAALASRRLLEHPRIILARSKQQPRLTSRGQIWSPAPEPQLEADVRVTERWFLDGKPLRSLPRALPWAYAGHRLHAQVIATQPGYRTASVTTAPVVVRARFADTPRPVIGDQDSPVSVGQTVRARAPRWSPQATRVRYQWYVGKQKIRGATSSRLKVRSSYRGKRIRVRITGSRNGFDMASRFSATVPVTRR